MKRKSTKQSRTPGKLNRKRDAEACKLNNQAGRYELSMIQTAIYELAAEGLIYDTGRRRRSERTQSYQIVWAAVPGKHMQSRALKGSSTHPAQNSTLCC
jgi:hypothetical protein